MIKFYLKYILLFIFSVLIQVLVFDKISMSGYINVFIYILFILMLPVDANKFFVIFLSFILGLSVDIFNSTQGIHASAAVLIAYLRPFVFRIYSPRDGYDILKTPGIKSYGFFWFIKYSITLVLIHHFFIFFVEAFRFSEFFFTLTKIVLSSIVSLVFVTLGHLLVMKD